MTLAPGEVFAEWRIDAIVDRGGAGDVYEATNRFSGRRVALKVFEAIAGDQVAVRRFMREWRIAASFQHPNVIPLYAADVEDGRPCVAMRYVAGRDLGALVRSERTLDPAVAARIVAQAAAGMHAAHARGFVHRNLRPSKILVAANDVFVIGLGEVRENETFEEALAGEKASDGTIGSVDFMAPEQIRGDSLRPQTDVYLLGCLLFYAVVGKTLEEVAGWSGMAGLLARLNRPPSLPEETPPELRDPITRALATSPEDRPDARELGHMLLAAFTDSPARFWVDAAPPPSPVVEFRVLDTLLVSHDGLDRRIDLCSGDLTSLPASESCDVLVVSAIPGSYFPTQGSLIGALARKGVSIEQLAQHKAVDLRSTCSCWLSVELGGGEARLGYRRILCFEPAGTGSPAEFVGDIFRALLPFLGDSGFKTVAMPVVSSGDAGNPVAEMLRALVEAATNWMSLGVSLERLLIFAPLAPEKREETCAVFSELKRSHPLLARARGGTWDYEVFLSYAHEDNDVAAFIAEELEQIKPGVRLYVDRQRLNPGSSWQHDIFDALDSSGTVLAVYSPAYVRSKVCKEEFNIAWARGRDLDRRVLFPVYLFTAQLPTYMKLVQYVDCREGSRELLASACKHVLMSGAG